LQQLDHLNIKYVQQTLYFVKYKMNVEKNL